MRVDRLPCVTHGQRRCLVVADCASHAAKNKCYSASGGGSKDASSRSWPFCVQVSWIKRILDLDWQRSGAFTTCKICYVSVVVRLTNWHNFEALPALKAGHDSSLLCPVQGKSDRTRKWSLLLQWFQHCTDRSSRHHMPSLQSGSVSLFIQQRWNINPDRRSVTSQNQPWFFLKMRNVAAGDQEFLVARGFFALASCYVARPLSCTRSNNTCCQVAVPSVLRSRGVRGKECPDVFCKRGKVIPNATVRRNRSRSSCCCQLPICSKWF